MPQLKLTKHHNSNNIINGLHIHIYILSTSGAMIPIRGIAYICLALPCFFSYPCMMAGIVLIIVGIVNCLASLHGERVNQGTIRKGEYCLCSKEGSSSWDKEDKDPNAPKESLLKKLSSRLLEGSQLSQAVMVSVYVLLNAGMCEVVCF
jgi:hypothetical protein